MTKRLTIATAYERVNATWPADVPSLSPEEAERAARRLYRWALGETWDGPVHVSSGNRYSGAFWRDGVKTLVVNPERGWKSFVHNLSHNFYWWANRGAKPHSKEHASVEKAMIKEVIRRGWLGGKLKSGAVEEAKPSRLELIETKLVRIDRRIEDWERKAKRAATQLQALHRTRRALMRRIETEEREHGTPAVE